VKKFTVFCNFYFPIVDDCGYNSAYFQPTWQPNWRCPFQGQNFQPGLQPALLFYLPVQIRKGFGSLIGQATIDGNNLSRTGNRTHPAANAPILIHLGFILDHFNGIDRADIGTGAAANAFRQFGFADKIDGHQHVTRYFAPP
jgi:hypothetical protein